MFVVLGTAGPTNQKDLPKGLLVTAGPPAQAIQRLLQGDQSKSRRWAILLEKRESLRLTSVLDDRALVDSRLISPDPDDAILSAFLNAQDPKRDLGVAAALRERLLSPFMKQFTKGTSTEGWSVKVSAVVLGLDPSGKELTIGDFPDDRAGIGFAIPSNFFSEERKEVVSPEIEDVTWHFKPILVSRTDQGSLTGEVSAEIAQLIERLKQNKEANRRNLFSLLALRDKEFFGAWDLKSPIDLSSFGPRLDRSEGRNPDLSRKTGTFTPTKHGIQIMFTDPTGRRYGTVLHYQLSGSGKP